MLPVIGAIKNADEVADVVKSIVKHGDEAADAVKGAVKNADDLVEAGKELKISDSQFGKKVGKHAVDFGLDPSNPASRDFVKNRANDIYTKPTEIREGLFRGQGAILPNGASASGEVKFYIQGNDVVITDMNDNFVTIMKDGINNPSVSRGTKIWP